MARHVNPTDAEKTATAPYNFVPLPDTVFVVEGGIEVNGEKIFPWKMHNHFISGTRSGWIDLRIKTLTPLFIRGPILEKDRGWDGRDARLRPGPCTSMDGRPMIPGSSLRGTIRTLVEILSCSKIVPVTDKKPFFRSVAADRIGIAYRNRIIRGNLKPMGGYVCKNGNQWAIVPATEVLRVHRDALNRLNLNIPPRPNPNYFPNWTGQHKACWFRREAKRAWKVAEISLSQSSTWENGTLVLTGSSPNKKYDFVFVGEDATSTIAIPEMIRRRFLDEDQLTQWQEKAFPRDKPSQKCRKAKGHLRQGEPVFFLIDESVKSDENPNGLVFFGRAQMFRFPYDLSPSNLVPAKIKNAGLDMAEAMFGMVGPAKNKKDQAIKGRVFFENAIATGGGPDWFEEIIVPRILSSPKVTCFQHYLTQDGTRSQKELTTYLNGDQTTTRGHKLYWHRWNADQRLRVVKESNNHDGLRDDLQSASPNDTQHTIIQPVKTDVTFSSRIRFENLTQIELGALLSALRLADGCAHRLGMGKPLGLGSIKIESELHLIDRAARYNCWQDSGASESDGGDSVSAFEEVMLKHARSAREPVDESMSGLKKIGRLQTLFHLLQWSGRPQLEKTEYMGLQNFRSRPVLPTPHGVLGQREPAWRSDPPQPAQKEKDSAKLESTTPTAAGGPTLPPPQANKPIEKGQTRNGVLKRSGDRWIVLFEGEPRQAVIINQSKIPLDAAEDCSAEFFITEQSKKSGIKARFEKLA
jgi:CRISPR-associated protein (TIGR03986 family)